MRNVYTIDQYEVLHNQFFFIVKESDEHIQIQPAAQVIADSDNKAFIYIVEENGVFSYLRFARSIWPQLVEVVKSKQDPSLRVGAQQIVLTNFFEELSMLLFNIEGNSNYGEDFVQAVEQSFAEIFQANEV